MYLVLWLCCMVNIVFCESLSQTLRYYELLHINDINHRIVRRDLTESGHGRSLNFNFAGKNYSVTLEQKNDIITSDFQAISIDSKGNESPITIDELQYYKGVVENDDQSLVLAHIENKMITAEIILEKDTLYIEPSQPHIDGKDNHMLIYRLSDVLWNLTETNSSVRMHEKNCVTPLLTERGSQQAEPLPKKHEKTSKQRQKNRKRRSVAIDMNMCEMVLVADYQYFKNIGQSKKMTTINHMLQVISRVHEIYRRTDFTGVGTNIGFKVKKVLVHEDFSTGDQHSYNRENGGLWNVDQLLTVFSRTNWKDFCLSHLFTYQDFDNGIIGLAYVASPSVYEVGGICTRSYTDVGGARFLNCGLSSSVNWGRRLLTAESDLVTAHEIGHNFGSNHDPSICQGGSAGNYIMYAHAVTGEKENNNRFSDCSKASMGAVLKSKRHMCFSEQKENTFCGNLIVEPGEECDSGLLEDYDACCTSSCKFRTDLVTNKPYICSDTHDPCCTNCRVSSNTKVCQEASPFHCKGKTYCSGLSSRCPEPVRLDGNEKCGFRQGNCLNGTCTSLCQQKGKISCSCSAGSSSCKLCCQDSASSECLLLEGNYDEADGTGCALEGTEDQGQCVAGTCQKTRRNVKNEFSSLLDDFTLSKFVRFMEANIVGTILTLSLFVWIPASCTVYYLDKKQAKHDKFLTTWKDPKNKELLAQSVPGRLKNFMFRGSKRKKTVKSQFHIST